MAHCVRHIRRAVVSRSSRASIPPSSGLTGKVGLGLGWQVLGFLISHTPFVRSSWFCAAPSIPSYANHDLKTRGLFPTCRVSPGGVWGWFKGRGNELVLIRSLGCLPGLQSAGNLEMFSGPLLHPGRIQERDAFKCDDMGCGWKPRDCHAFLGNTPSRAESGSIHCDASGRNMWVPHRAENSAQGLRLF